jgi:hypothetical protein
MTFNNGVPQSVTLIIPRQSLSGYNPDLNFYVQDRWTINRATISGGLRYDYFEGYVGDSTLPPSRWNPPQFFSGSEAQHWKDVSPRAGIAYDVFGDGKTAVKASSGHLNRFDARLSKRFRVGRYRLRGDLNLYNVFNSDFINSVNTTFSTTAGNAFMRPTGVLVGRLFKIGGQIEF